MAPTIINTFFWKATILRAKTIRPFATSGGSGMGKTVEDAAASLPGRALGSRAKCSTALRIASWKAGSRAFERSIRFMTEKEKMRSGEFYDTRDSELRRLSGNAKDPYAGLQQLPAENMELRNRILRLLFGFCGEKCPCQSACVGGLRLPYFPRRRQPYQYELHPFWTRAELPSATIPCSAPM